MLKTTPRQKRTLVLLGHPDTDSFCGALADAYVDGVERAGAPVRRINLGDLQFDPVLHKGYKVIQDLEPDLLELQEAILWAEHVVFVYPLWWGGMPAVMKGFIDRAFHPKFGFKFVSDTSYIWKGLLTGRSARLIVTMDAPPIAMRLMFNNPQIQSFRNVTLRFCGFSPVRVSQFGSVKRSTRARRFLWRLRARELGERQC
ncbi:MAG: flavodoxin family protein [Candidatus Hydrogenedens sp.]|nr:flavodoxin family protein [Candidatus Hydrogenedens sp.]